MSSTHASSGYLGTSTSATLSVITLRPGGQLVSEETLGPLYQGMVSQLHQSLGVLVVGLMLVAISFWVVCVKAMQYYAGRAKADGRGTKATLATLIALNLVQFVIAVYQVYRSVVLNFGDLFKLLDNDWCIPIQILVMALTACVAQGFFTHMLHTIRRNQFVNKSSIALIVTQFIMAIVSVAELFQLGYGAIMIFDFGYVRTERVKTLALMTESFQFSIYAMFGFSASINVALASVLYLLQRRGAPSRTFREQLQYWTFESLMGCGVLSVFAAVMLGVAGLDLVWLVTTFSLGNLYTLSVLFSLSTPRLSPSAKPQDQSKRPSAMSVMSTPTLTNDVEERRGAGQLDEAATTPAAAVPVKNPDGKLEYVLGYHTGDAAATLSFAAISMYLPGH
ncbi:hypothetical protein K466DRAFT_662982 [Polyporus arcularius HHB13444]|uniref:Uncharacterized protein n=1 Tax=Polyporus arcularius HHB13444 TaxID=1314778 RepID=A0A5C3PD09_9APHY|nr:hypothetical protein K466DRAFT_662982 [Polyporus arcularius HHB13444]